MRRPARLAPPVERRLFRNAGWNVAARDPDDPTTERLICERDQTCLAGKKWEQ